MGRGKTQKRDSGRACTCAGAGLAAAAVMITVSVVKADVLHDTSWMITNQTANSAMPSYIGGLGAFSELRDVNVADDIVVPDGPGYDITSVTGAFALQNPVGGQLPAHGLLIEFFADTGAGSPEAQPAASVLTQNFTATAFDASPWAFDDAYWLTADLGADGITLGSGVWWISIVPVDETKNGGDWRWFRQAGHIDGATSHFRDGGEAHGNGYFGNYGTSDWSPFGFPFGAGDVAMTIEGTLVPAPGALALLGCAGVAGMGSRRRRR